MKCLFRCYNRFLLADISPGFMFKYQFDPSKKKQFLDYWGLKEVKTFSKKASDSAYFFYHYARLDSACQRAMGDLVSHAMQKGQAEIKKGRLRTSRSGLEIHLKKWNVPSKVMEQLETLNFVSLIRDRSDPNMSKKDTAVTTPAATAFLKNILYLDDAIKGDLLEKGLIPKKELKGVLATIYTDFFSPVRLDFKSFKQFLKNKHIVFGLDRRGEARLFTEVRNRRFRQRISTKHIEIKERLARYIHALDGHFFWRFSHSSSQTKIKADHLRVDPEISKRWAEKLAAASIETVFFRLPFYNKIYHLLKVIYPDVFPMLPELILGISEGKGVSFLEGYRLWNRYRNKRGRPSLDQRVMRRQLEQLEELNLVHISQGQLFFYPPVLAQVWAVYCREENLPEEEKIKDMRREDEEEKVTIDSDRQMTAYRDQASTEMFYFCLTLGKTTLSEHLYTVRLEEERSTFASFCGINYEYTLRFLRPRLHEASKVDLAAMTRDLFQSSRCFQSRRVFYLEIYSRLLLEKAAHLLTAEEIPFLKIPRNPEASALVFLCREDYQRGKTVLASIKAIVV